jgi:hypothetical protein
MQELPRATHPFSSDAGASTSKERGRNNPRVASGFSELGSRREYVYIPPAGRRIVSPPLWWLRQESRVGEEGEPLTLGRGIPDRSRTISARFCIIGIALSAIFFFVSVRAPSLFRPSFSFQCSVLSASAPCRQY